MCTTRTRRAISDSERLVLPRLAAPSFSGGSSEQLDPDPIGVTDERKCVPRFVERRNLRSSSLRYDIPKGLLNVRDSEREVIEFLTLAVFRMESRTRRIPVEFQPLRGPRALHLDPKAAMAHPTFPRDPHAHDLPVELHGRCDVSNPDSSVKEFHHAQTSCGAS